MAKEKEGVFTKEEADATKAAETKTATRRASVAPEVSELPAGFTSVIPNRTEGYVQPREGLIVHGTLMGRHSKRGRFGGHYYQIKLARSVVAERKPEEGEGDDYILFEAQPGTIVSIDERAALEGLKEYEPERTEVFIKFLTKEKLDDGRTFWRTSVGVKVS